ncbi:Dihydrolipoyllysine-residue acetyltransferase component of acetoin cleaving system [Anaerolineae bacterium]|nr:Dihydrolipoyllysine-residue acetyltransferase component of acetoin cleaving system [Anaerolineae bacterium]
MSFTLVNGEKISYAALGAHGLPVIFIHGAGSNHLIWGNQLRAVGEVARGVALDLPGHGRSEGAGRNTVDAYRDVIVGVLDALTFDRAVIVGHSLGGASTQMLAWSHPERVAGIALVVPARVCASCRRFLTASLTISTGLRVSLRRIVSAPTPSRSCSKDPKPNFARARQA